MFLMTCNQKLGISVSYLELISYLECYLKTRSLTSSSLKRCIKPKQPELPSLCEPVRLLKCQLEVPYIFCQISYPLLGIFAKGRIPQKMRSVQFRSHLFLESNSAVNGPISSIRYGLEFGTHDNTNCVFQEHPSGSCISRGCEIRKHVPIGAGRRFLAQKNLNP